MSQPSGRRFSPRSCALFGFFAVAWSFPSSSFSQEITSGGPPPVSIHGRGCQPERGRHRQERPIRPGPRCRGLSRLREPRSAGARVLHGGSHSGDPAPAPRRFHQHARERRRRERSGIELREQALGGRPGHHCRFQRTGPVQLALLGRYRSARADHPVTLPLGLDRPLRFRAAVSRKGVRGGRAEGASGLHRWGRLALRRVRKRGFVERRRRGSEGLRGHDLLRRVRGPGGSAGE